jgi:NADH-quinone oxidoreductase subunit M
MLLTTILFLPLLFGILLAVWQNQNTLRALALGFSLIEFFLSLVMFSLYDPKSPSIQLVERFSWIERFGIQYFIGLDGLSIWLVMLTTFLLPITILASWNSIEDRVKGFHIALFILQTAMLGTFLALDGVLFYLFWELSIVPMYFMIGIWGGKRRIYATVKFFIFTMVGSVLMLVALIYLMLLTQEIQGKMSASIIDFYKLHLPYINSDFFTPQTLMFFAFSLAFAIKVPIFPFHTWLPDAHVEAPTSGSVILAAVMLKMGTFGFLRWAIPIFPEAAQQWSWLFLVLGVIGIIYGAWVAMVQPDMKKLVAYSSVSHMGYVILGMFAFNEQGVTGSFYQMLNHGVSTGALFILIGMLYERTHSREISKYGGLASAMPIYTIFFFIVLLSSIAVPLTNGFVGEFLILLGVFKVQKVIAALAVLGVVFGATYMLWMFKRVFFGKRGELVNDVQHPLQDLNLREIGILTPFIILIFWMGVFPMDFLKWSDSSIKHFVENKRNYYLTVSESPSTKKVARLGVPNVRN